MCYNSRRHTLAQTCTCEAGGFRRECERIELLDTILLAFAAIATAWAGFESAKWGDVQATSFASAGASRTESTRFLHLGRPGGAGRYRDVHQLAQCIGIRSSDWLGPRGRTPALNTSPNPRLSLGFLFERFRLEFFSSVQAWLSTNPFSTLGAPSSPFEMAEYELSSQTQADELRAQADAFSTTAHEANRNSNDYVLTAVMFALVLFFVAVAGKLRGKASSVLAFTLGAVMFVGALARILSLPVEI